MFGDSTKEMLFWIAGTLLAGLLTMYGVRFLADNYIYPPNPVDPLTKQGGLQVGQEIRQK
jgi:hypothetical protein